MIHAAIGERSLWLVAAGASCLMQKLLIGGRIVKVDPKELAQA
jgi:hypothetical protein